jgi:hypothetical protein
VTRYVFSVDDSHPLTFCRSLGAPVHSIRSRALRCRRTLDRELDTLLSVILKGGTADRINEKIVGATDLTRDDHTSGCRCRGRGTIVYPDQLRVDRAACFPSRPLPDFMHETAPWRANRVAIDLARFERALSDAFDAADAPLSSIDALADICAEDWPRIVFDFHPSLMLLDLGRRTAQIYAALAAKEEPPAIQQDEGAIHFWRKDGQSFYRPLADDERLALIEARQGKKFSDISLTKRATKT